MVSTQQSAGSSPCDACPLLLDQELHELVDEADGAGALRAIAAHVRAFRHPARLAYIRGMAAAAQRAGFAVSHEAFSAALRELPNALEPEVRCAWANQLAPLGTLRARSSDLGTPALACMDHHTSGPALHESTSPCAPVPFPAPDRQNLIDPYQPALAAQSSIVRCPAPPLAIMSMHAGTFLLHMYAYLG